jgi:Zn-finger protein
MQAAVGPNVTMWYVLLCVGWNRFSNLFQRDSTEFIMDCVRSMSPMNFSIPRSLPTVLICTELCYHCPPRLHVYFCANLQEGCLRKSLRGSAILSAKKCVIVQKRSVYGDVVTPTWLSWCLVVLLFVSKLYVQESNGHEHSTYIKNRRIHMGTWFGIVSCIPERKHIG